MDIGIDLVTRVINAALVLGSLQEYVFVVTSAYVKDVTYACM
jgi:hypothetical protein